MPGAKELPSTLRRSSSKAQRTWIEAHDSAVDQYGEGRRSHQTAYAALKHSFEKVGDHWEAKDGKGPSDAQSAQSHRDKPKPTAGGVDANASKSHLYDIAKRLHVRGRSSMTKRQLVQAIEKANDRKTAEAR